MQSYSYTRPGSIIYSNKGHLPFCQFSVQITTICRKNASIAIFMAKWDAIFMRMPMEDHFYELVTFAIFGIYLNSILLFFNFLI